jgi:hypothetical protein
MIYFSHCGVQTMLEVTMGQTCALIPPNSSTSPHQPTIHTNDRNNQRDQHDLTGRLLCDIGYI